MRPEFRLTQLFNKFAWTIPRKVHHFDPLLSILSDYFLNNSCFLTCITLSCGIVLCICKLKTAKIKFEIINEIIIIRSYIITIIKYRDFYSICDEDFWQG